MEKDNHIEVTELTVGKPQFCNRKARRKADAIAKAGKKAYAKQAEARAKAANRS